MCIQKVTQLARAVNSNEIDIYSIYSFPSKNSSKEFIKDTIEFAKSEAILAGRNPLILDPV